MLLEMTTVVSRQTSCTYSSLYSRDIKPLYLASIQGDSYFHLCLVHNESSNHYYDFVQYKFHHIKVCVRVIFMSVTSVTIILCHELNNCTNQVIEAINLQYSTVQYIGAVLVRKWPQ